MLCGMVCVLHTGTGQYRSGRSSIPCGGVRGRSWSIFALHTGAGQCRSGRFAIPCGGCAGCSWARSGWAADRRDASVIPWSVGWLRLARGCRSVPLGTLCDTMRCCTWSIVDHIGLCCRRSGRFGGTFRLRCAPGVRLGTLRGEVPHLFAGRIRCSAVDVRTTVGLNRLGEVRVQTGGTCFISRT